jgi:hypothetical protein
MTSIEWLENELKKSIHFYRLIEDIESKSTIVQPNIFKQAKGMHKKEIMHAHYFGGINEQSGNFNFFQEDNHFYQETFGSKGSDDHISDISKMVKKGTLKKRMDKDAWFVVFQSNAYNENDMAYDLLKSQEIDIDMYDVYKDGDEVTFEVVNKKWAKITPFLYPFETTSSQQEISDEEIEKAKENAWSDYEYQEGNLYSTTFSDGWKMAIKWYREQLKKK